MHSQPLHTTPLHLQSLTNRFHAFCSLVLLRKAAWQVTLSIRCAQNTSSSRPPCDTWLHGVKCCFYWCVIGHTAEKQCHASLSRFGLQCIKKFTWREIQCSKLEACSSLTGLYWLQIKCRCNVASGNCCTQSSICFQPSLTFLLCPINMLQW